MKLFVKITIIFLSISLVVFLIGGAITYSIIKREIDLEERLFLQERLSGAINFIEHRAPEKEFVRDKMLIKPLGPGTEPSEIQFSDTLIMHATLERVEPHLKLDVIREVGGRSYFISIWDLIVEEDDIVEGVMESLIKMFLLLFGVVVVLTIVLSNYLLKPFNITLNQIRNFSLNKEEPTEFPETGTSEFKRLNKFLEEMIRKSKDEYNALKEFAGNASHEMQTPLAIARGNLEILVENENLNDEQRQSISKTQESIQKMSKLVNALLLLTKIENKEFGDLQKIDVTERLEKLIENYSELIDLKGISLTKNLNGRQETIMDSTLLDILLGNLLQNTIRHNVKNGTIEITGRGRQFIIENTGRVLNTNTEELFDRFKKGDQSSESLGLGLSIVKKICDENHIGIDYKHKERKHTIILTFP